MSLILLTFLIIGLCNGQTIVNLTASNSTGDYYITDSVNKFANSEIHCDSDIACYIECVTKNSCSKLTVYCGNSPICDIVCGNDYACRWGLHVYISPNATTISCAGWGSCKEIIWLYTNYTYHPSSTTSVDCHEDSYCNDIAIIDAITEQDNYDELTVDRFKIYCEYCSWESYSASNLLTIPTIVNETGEYYIDSGSLVDIQCTTDKLCYIDCNDRSCSYSNIDCGPSQECFILCGKNNGCVGNDVSAFGQNQFTYLCDANAVDCTDWGSFNLTDIDTVNITCQTTNGCSLNDWYITSVPDLNVQCDFYWSCSYSDWYLKNVDNAVVICNGSCRGDSWELNNVGYHTFDCVGDVTNPYSLTSKEACNDIEIDGEETTQLDMLCENEYSCQDMTICTDNILSLNCEGSSSCRRLNVCDATLQSNKTNIIRPPTPEPTTSQPTTNPTTAAPTYYPTTAEPTQVPTTGEPTQNPTTSEPTTSDPTTNPTTATPTQNPTTAEPTAPTDSPTTTQPSMEIPIHSNGGHRLFAWFWVVLVIDVIYIAQIM